MFKLRNLLIAGLMSLAIFGNTIHAENQKQQTIKNRLDAIFSQAYASEMPGASVLVAHKGDILLHKAYGMADMEHNIPLRTVMHFRIASITKPITSVAALLLEQEGALSLKDPLQQHLPGYPTQGHALRVEQLANNTSGIPDYTRFEGFEARERTHTTLDQLIAYFSHKPFNFAPGEQFEYSSSNFVLLGKLLEVTSGKNYQNYLQEHLFEPLNMDSSFYGSYRKILPNRVRGYELEKGELINAPYLSMTVPHAAGALRSTTGDLYKWQKGLLDGKLVNSKLLTRAWSRTQLNRGGESNYGYGWFIGQLDGAKTVAHDGSIPGFNTYAALLPEEDLHVIVLSNLPSVRLDRLVAKVIQTVRGRPLEPSPKPVPDKFLNSLQGEYRFMPGDYLAKIDRKDNALFMQFPWQQEPTELLGGSDRGLYFSGTWSVLRPAGSGSKVNEVIIERWDGVTFSGSRVE